MARPERLELPTLWFEVLKRKRMWFRVAKGESSRAEMLAFMGGHGFELTAVETQNEGRQENLSFAADSMAHK